MYTKRLYVCLIMVGFLHADALGGGATLESQQNIVQSNMSEEQLWVVANFAYLGYRNAQIEKSRLQLAYALARLSTHNATRNSASFDETEHDQNTLLRNHLRTVLLGRKNFTQAFTICSDWLQQHDAQWLEEFKMHAQSRLQISANTAWQEVQKVSAKAHTYAYDAVQELEKLVTRLKEMVEHNPLEQKAQEGALILIGKAHALGSLLELYGNNLAQTGSYLSLQLEHLFESSMTLFKELYEQTNTQLTKKSRTSRPIPLLFNENGLIKPEDRSQSLPLHLDITDA